MNECQDNLLHWNARYTDNEDDETEEYEPETLSEDDYVDRIMNGYSIPGQNI